MIPQIETPQDESELHVQSIGQLIAERIKYKVHDMEIVSVDVAKRWASIVTADVDVRMELRGLIRHMTLIAERPTADQVLKCLQAISQPLGQIFVPVKGERLKTP